MAKETLVKQKHAVNIEVGKKISIGPITGSIIRAWAEYGNVEVTEVPEGEGFDVAIQYSISNPGFTVSPLDPSWSLSFTAMSLDREVHASEFALMVSRSASSTDRIEGLVMPTHDIVLRVNMWGNQAALQHYPPFDRWLET